MLYLKTNSSFNIDLNILCKFAVLVLNEVDKLSREAQHSLRRTMEKYSASCRLILCCNSSSKVTEAVRSRCLNVRVNAPTEDQVSNGYLMPFLLQLVSVVDLWLDFMVGATMSNRVFKTCMGSFASDFGN